MPVIDLVKWNGNPNILAWKFPSTEELSTWTQLIVNETQEAYLVKGGVYEGPFGAGRHTLSTENLPVLRTLLADTAILFEVTRPSREPQESQQ